MRRWTTILCAAAVAALCSASSTLAVAKADDRLRTMHADFTGPFRLAREAAGSEAIALQMVEFGAYPLDQSLVARVDDLGLDRPGLFDPNPVAATRPGSNDATSICGIRLPEPAENRWMSLCATIALGLFFFLRRIA